MKIAIGCDPNAQQAKEELIKFMEDKGYGEIKDFGSEDPIYANTAVAVAEAVASGEYDRGILICGTGLGVSIAANKVKGNIWEKIHAGKPFYVIWYVNIHFGARANCQMRVGEHRSASKHRYAIFPE